ncbi:MAG: FAD:protein FMN transferase [Clostridia bacterium]|nr:FAD:protein FMN transferase [Clostridia bacterium]
MKKRILLLLLCLFLLGGCQGKELYSAQYYMYFDTLTEIKFYSAPDKEQTITQAVDFALMNYHQLCDIYNEHPGVNNVCTINNANGKEVEIDYELMAILKFACENYALADKKVNIASGAVLSLWHDARNEGTSLPDEAALTEALNHCDPSDIIFGENTVRLADKNMSLDLGAVAKGYVADIIKDVMIENGATAGTINMGGNVVCFGGASEDRDYFVAGVQDPRSNEICAKVKVRDASLVTSGDYQRFYEVDGVRYHHIIDLETGYPGGDFSSVTVFHESSKVADLLSTALFLSDKESGEELARNWGAEVLWIDADGNMEYTDGFPIME